MWGCLSMVSVPFKILRKETAASWVIREVTLSTAGRRGLVISKSSTTQLKAIGRHRSNTPPWQVSSPSTMASATTSG